MVGSKHPLCLMAKDGAQRDVAREVFEEVKDDKEILALAFSLASMVLTSESDQRWLEGEVAMFEDILRDTWFYQKILKEGREGGREEERKRELQTLGQILVSSVEANFPSLVPLDRRCTETTHDTEILKKAILQVVSTKDVDMARNHLLVALEESSVK